MHRTLMSNLTHKNSFENSLRRITFSKSDDTQNDLKKSYHTTEIKWAAYCLGKSAGERKSHLFFFVFLGGGIIVLLEEGTLQLGADQLSFLLLLREVRFELVCGETHLGVSHFVRNTMSTEPWVLETLGCSGPPPTKITFHPLLIYTLN